jgi:hypothetical protein
MSGHAPIYSAALRSNLHACSTAWHPTCCCCCCRCSGLLFCSPENYTTNHKTDFQEVAFNQAMQCGAQGRNVDLQRSLYVWNAEQGSWAHHTYAAQLLSSHFDRFWRHLVRALL